MRLIGCPNCKKTLSVPPDLGNRSAVCPFCKTTFSASEGPPAIPGQGGKSPLKHGLPVAVPRSARPLSSPKDPNKTDTQNPLTPEEFSRPASVHLRKKSASPLPFIIIGGILGFIGMGFLTIPLLTKEQPEKKSPDSPLLTKTKEVKKGEKKKEGSQQKESPVEEEKVKEEKKEKPKPLEEKPEPPAKKSSEKEVAKQGPIGPWIAAYDYSAIDKHALAAPVEEEKTPARLGAYLASQARNDREKARAIFRWITDRISYDAESFFNNSFTQESNFPETVLKTRKGVCAGYACLFQELARFGGLPQVITINGYAKGVSYKPGEELKPNHAWNAIRLDGHWRMIESTWGAGSLSDKAFKKGFDDYYFLTAPEDFIFRHFPENPEEQFFSPQVTRAEMQNWPMVKDDLIKFGVPTVAIRKFLNENMGKELADTYHIPKGKYRLLNIPLSGKVKAGQAYRYQVESDDFERAALIQNGKFTFFQKTGKVFTLETVMPSGEFRLGLQMPGGKTFWGILKYQAE